LELRGDTSAFSDELEVEDSIGHSLAHSLNHIVTGRLVNQPGSIVDGQIRNGIFSGSIFSPTWGNYYVEHQNDKKGVTHSIIYHESEINHPEVNCKEMRHRNMIIDFKLD